MRIFPIHFAPVPLSSADEHSTPRTRFVAVHESANGTKRTCSSHCSMSA